MKNAVLFELEKCLSNCERYLDEDKKIIKSKVQKDALNTDEFLISLLLNNTELKSAFFKEVNGVLVFDKVSFSWIVNSSEFLPNSFTAFKNKIGLVDSLSNFISQSEDVSLYFPYKDCVLEFDSTSENEQRDEVYFNEILCKMDIDCILKSKILSNPIKYDVNGNMPVTEYIGENLVIKGNNLISMYSLLGKYEGKIKCMYWDILYNTNSDKVPYNDSFKHSSWLTMMKNRLEVARRLLSNNGCIVMQCDDNEQAYLKVLCDETFGRDNCVNVIALNTSTVSGQKIAHISKGKSFPKTKEYLLVYAKDKKNIFIKIPKIHKETFSKRYDRIIPQWTKEDLTLLENETLDISECNKRISNYEIYTIKEYAQKNNINITDEWLWENAYRIFVVDPNKSLSNLYKDTKFDKKIAFVKTSRGLNKFIITDFNRNAKITNIELANAELKSEIYISDNWTDSDVLTTGNHHEGNVTLLNGKKPERLLKRIIESFTDSGDIVLDAYFGTGTTGAVAMKLGRKFIGLEQLDSHFDKSVTRLTNVINGDTTGISEEVNWQGGGEFVSCELLKQNEIWIELISKANDNNIDAIYDELLDNPFVVNYKVNIELMKTAEIKDDFKDLSLEDKKKVLIALVDKNNLYVNYCDKDDENINVSDKDIAFSKSFYGD